MEPVISIIIPIYNAEKYIEKCVDCIQKQSYQNLEIILVEDGSPDNCGHICDLLAAKDNRIKVIHKENKGAASARNAGLDAAAGKYIAFVDADDYILENYIMTLYLLLTENEAQVSICDFEIVDEHANRIYIDELHEEKNRDADTAIKVLSGKDIILEDLQGHWEHVAPWGKLFKAELFQNVRFPNWVRHEDESVFIQVFEQVDKVLVCKDKLYYYVQHEGSLMNRAYSEIDRSTYLTMWRERLEYYTNQNPKNARLLVPVQQAYVSWAILYLTQYADEMTKEQQDELKQEIKKYRFSLWKKPYLYHFIYSVKTFVKSIIVLNNTELLRKRYQ